MKNVLKKLDNKIKKASPLALMGCLLLFLIGGGIIVQHSSEKYEMIEIAKKHKKEMDKQVRYGDKDHHIKTITYEWNTVKHNPMGGFMLNGYINKNKSLTFQVSVDKNSEGDIVCNFQPTADKLAEWEGMK